MKTGIALVTTLLAVAGSTQATNAGILVNGGFEDSLGAVPFLPTSSLPGWTVQGQIDLITTYWQPASGHQSIDLSGSPGPVGMSLSQSFATQPGSKYELTFQYANNTDVNWAKAEVDVQGQSTRLDAQIQHAGSTPMAMNYTTFREDFIADSTTTTLRFTHLGSDLHPDWSGIALDDVAVTAVPEPAEYGSMAAVGLLGLGLLRRVRRSSV